MSFKGTDEDVVAAVPEAAKKPKKAGEDQPEAAAQVSLESMAGDEVTRALRELDLNTVTPIEALNLLFELKKKVSP